jgi:O-antigen ligase
MAAMKTAATFAADDAKLDLSTLEAGLAVIVLIVLPAVPRAFSVPKEAALCLVSAFVFLLTAASAAKEVRPWSGRWYVLLSLPLLAMTVAAVAEGVHLFASDGVIRAWTYASFALAVHLACVETGDVERLTGFAAILGGAEGALILLQVPFGGAIADLAHLPSAKWLAFGTIGNPNWVGAFLASVLPLAWMRTALAPKGLTRLGWSAATAAIGGGLVLTFSRGAWLGAALGLIVLSAIASPARCRRAVTSAALGIALGAGIAWASTPPGEISAAVWRTASVSGRVRMWQITLDMIADRPALGVGPGAFAGSYPVYQREYLRRLAPPPPLTQLTDQPHNEYLRLLAEAGPAALLCFLTVCASVASAARAVHRDRGSAALAAGSGLTAGIVVLLVCAAVDNPLQVPVTAALFCLFVVALLSLAAARQPATDPDPVATKPGETGRRAPAPPLRRLTTLQQAGLAAAGALLLAQGVRLLVVERHHATARAAIGRADWAMADYFARAGLRLESEHGELWAILARSRAALDDLDGFEAAFRRARRGGLIPSLVYIDAAVELRQRHTSGAIDALVDVRDTLPGLVRPRLMLAQVHVQTGDLQAARRELEAIPAIAPGDATARRLADQARHLLASLDALEAGDAPRAGQTSAGVRRDG